MPIERPPKRLATDFIRRLLWVVGASYLAYLIAGNIFLNTPLATRLVNGHPETFEARWTRAETWWPGQVRAEHLRIRGHAREWLWSVDVAQASGRVQVWALFRRELRFGRVRISQVNINVQPAGSDHKPPPWRADAWWITFERIQTSSLRNLQWVDWVLAGNAAGEAGFTHQLRGGTTRIFPSHLTDAHASLGYRTQTWLQDLSLNLHFAVDPFTHDQPPGWHKIELASIHVVAAGATPIINLGINSPMHAVSSAAPSNGHLATDFLIDHGVLAAGGYSRWSGLVETAGTNGAVQYLAGQAVLTVKNDALDGHFAVPPAATGAGTRAADHMLIDARFGSRRLLPLPSSKTALELLSIRAAGHWQFASLAWLTPLTSAKPWLQWNGAGEVDTDLSIAHGRLLPGSRLTIPRLALTARILGNIFSGSASANGLVVADPQGSYTAMNMVVKQFVLAPETAANQPYLRGQALGLEMRSSDDLLRFRDTVMARLHFAHADVPDLRTYNRYLPGKSLYFVEGHGSMGTDLTMDGNGNVKTGHMQLHSDGAQLAVGPSRLSGDINLDTELTMAKREGHAFDLHHFTLAMGGIHMEGSHDPPWWMTATLEQGRLDWDRPMRLDGAATMRMKDVSVLLALFADRGAFPKWIGHIIDAGEAQMKADVQAQRGDFVLDNLVASNERVSVMARLRIADGKPQGDIYARWGILDVGVALANGQRQFHLVDAARWYQSQPALITTTEVVAH